MESVLGLLRTQLPLPDPVGSFTPETVKSANQMKTPRATEYEFLVFLPFFTFYVGVFSPAFSSLPPSEMAKLSENTNDF